MQYSLKCFRFKQQFSFINCFLFLRWKISDHIIALAVVILSRFQCTTWELSETSLLHLSWWHYPCILLLIINKLVRFKFLVRWKENHLTFFNHVVCWGDSVTQELHARKLFACQISQRKGNSTTSSTTRMLVFWQRNKNNSKRDFRQERSWVKNLSIQQIFLNCFIDNNSHISLHIVFNSKWSEWSRRFEKKRKRNMKCFSKLSS